MQCPFCDADDNRVVDSRKRGGQVHRRRECKQCKRNFSSLEKLAPPKISVRKRNGRREPFDKNKLRMVLDRVFYGRPDEAACKERAADLVVRSLVQRGVLEIQWRELAMLAAEALDRTDPVAHCRFIGDYRILEDVGERVPDAPAEESDSQMSLDLAPEARRG